MTCLAIKLKASVQNDSLPLFGGIRFEIPHKSDGTFVFIGIIGTDIHYEYIVDDNDNTIGFYDAQDKYLGMSTTSNTSLKLKPSVTQDGVVHVTNKYKIISFYPKEGSGAFTLVDNPKVFEYCIDMVVFNLDLYQAKMNIPIPFNIEVLSKMVSLKKLRLYNFESSLSSILTGNIESLINLVKLEELYISRPRGIITGNINTLLDKLASAGKTTNLKIILTNVGKALTYNGEPVESTFNKSFAFSDGSWHVVE